MNQILQCMGGFCDHRYECAHYYAPPVSWQFPVKNLCQRGNEEPEVVKVVEFKEAA